ncbi:hypothetical protein AAVH_41257, partial [Aphelenchoides avenae]
MSDQLPSTPSANNATDAPPPTPNASDGTDEPVAKKARIDGPENSPSDQPIGDFAVQRNSAQ